MRSRRVFLKSGGMAMLSLGFAPGFLARAAAAAAGRRRLLIAIFQRGAVDGLNMVVPYGESAYYRLRPSIAVPRPAGTGTAIDLDGFFGLHPAMAPLGPLWSNRSLAIVHACGSHETTRSHFDAQDFMETATPGVKSTRDGWLNRYLAASADASASQAGRSGSPLRGIALTRQMPRTLQGRAAALNVGTVDEFQVRGGMNAQREAEQAFGGDPRLGRAAGDAFEAMRVLREATAAPYRPAPGVAYPRSPFGQALQEIARIAKADVGLEVAFAESNNWDHHAAEGGATGQLASRLTDLAQGLAALAADLGDRMADTVIMTMSEFGRTVAENGSRGTDHGHGNAMLLAGGPVRGGRVLGRWPGLDDDQRFEGRDLAVTTDFREVFSEVVRRHLVADDGAVAAIFPGFTVSGALGIIA
jgi:uncharacterized protein (DUF1501 family)